MLKKYGKIILMVIGLVAITALVEFYMGRSIWGPDGKFGWWDGNIWGSENSQRVADAYSFSHILHGIIFYALLSLFAKKIPVRHRFLLAVFLEAGWEILENSPIIINRYREVTISLGYVGDSILNSISDILFMSLGFLLASKAKIWVAVAVVLLIEIGCLLWIRDNLTLNIIMLIYPIESIKIWQSAGHEALLLP